VVSAFDQRPARSIRWEAIGKGGPARGDHAPGTAPGGSGGGAVQGHHPGTTAPMRPDHQSSSDLSSLLTPGSGGPIDQVTQTDGGGGSPSSGSSGPPPVDTGHLLPSAPPPPSGGAAPPSTSVPTSGDVQTPNLPDTSAPPTSDVSSQAGSTVDSASHLLTSG